MKEPRSHTPWIVGTLVFALLLATYVGSYIWLDTNQLHDDRVIVHFYRVRYVAPLFAPLGFIEATMAGKMVGVADNWGSRYHTRGVWGKPADAGDED